MRGTGSRSVERKTRRQWKIAGEIRLGSGRRQREFFLEEKKAISNNFEQGIISDTRPITPLSLIIGQKITWISMETLEILIKVILREVMGRVMGTVAIKAIGVHITIGITVVEVVIWLAVSGTSSSGKTTSLGTVRRIVHLQGENSVDTSTGGASGDSAATSSQAGSQGTSGSDNLLAMVTSSQADKGKKEKCFRCNLPAELCIYCDSALHKNENCHLLNMSKPTAVMYSFL
jgi:hypothetical protein